MELDQTTEEPQIEEQAPVDETSAQSDEEVLEDVDPALIEFIQQMIAEGYSEDEIVAEILAVEEEESGGNGEELMSDPEPEEQEDKEVSDKDQKKAEPPKAKEEKPKVKEEKKEEVSDTRLKVKNRLATHIGSLSRFS